MLRVWLSILCIALLIAPELNAYLHHKYEKEVAELKIEMPKIFVEINKLLVNKPENDKTIEHFAELFGLNRTQFEQYVPTSIDADSLFKYFAKTILSYNGKEMNNLKFCIFLINI